MAQPLEAESDNRPAIAQSDVDAVTGKPVLAPHTVLNKLLTGELCPADTELEVGPDPDDPMALALRAEGQTMRLSREWDLERCCFLIDLICYFEPSAVAGPPMDFVTHFWLSPEAIHYFSRGRLLPDGGVAVLSTQMFTSSEAQPAINPDKARAHGDLLLKLCAASTLIIRHARAVTDQGEADTAPATPLRLVDAPKGTGRIFRNQRARDLARAQRMGLTQPILPGLVHSVQASAPESKVED